MYLLRKNNKIYCSRLVSGITIIRSTYSQKIGRRHYKLIPGCEELFRNWVYFDLIKKSLKIPKPWIEGQKIQWPIKKDKGTNNDLRNHNIYKKLKNEQHVPTRNGIEGRCELRCSGRVFSHYIRYQTYLFIYLFIYLFQ